MTAALRRCLLLAALGATVPATALARYGDDHAPRAGDGADVVMAQSTFDARHVTVLVGERVGWLNGSSRAHTVTATGLFDSGRVGPGQSFSYAFAAKGSYAYVCRLHAGMTGTVDVATLLLHPTGPVVRGESLGIGGRGEPGGPPVTIERDAGAGFAALVTVPRAMDGSFYAPLAADATATFRAVSGPDVSAPVRVEVTAARTVTVTTHRGHTRRTVRAVVRPVTPGAVVHLQRHLRDRFGWWTVARRRVDGDGVARFSLRRATKGRIRLMLTKPDGETPVMVSRTLALRG